MRITWHQAPLIAFMAIAIILSCSFIGLTGDRSFTTDLPDLLRRSQTSAVIEIASGECLENLQRQDYVAALANCETAVASKQDNFEAHLNLGLVQYHLQNYPQAVKQYQLIIRQNSEDYRAFYNWGLVDAARGEYQQAIARYSKALSLASAISPSDRAVIFNDLGVVQIMSRQYVAAVASLNSSIDLDADNPASYFNRGCAHHHQGEYLAGIADFTQVIKLDSDYTQAYISRAILHHLVRQEKAAYTDLDLALQQYQTKGNRAAVQKIIELKDSMVKSQVRQTA